MKQKCHGFLMTRFVSVWDIPDFYIHCGFPNQETGGNAHSGPYVKTILASSTRRRGKKKVPSPEKRKHQLSPRFCWHSRWTFTACFNVQTGRKVHMIAL